MEEHYAILFYTLLFHPMGERKSKNLIYLPDFIQETDCLGANMKTMQDGKERARNAGQAQ